MMVVIAILSALLGSPNVSSMTHASGGHVAVTPSLPAVDDRRRPAPSVQADDGRCGCPADRRVTEIPSAQRIVETAGCSGGAPYGRLLSFPGGRFADSTSKARRAACHRSGCDARMVLRRVRALLGTVRRGASARLPNRRLQLALLKARALLRLERADEALERPARRRGDTVRRRRSRSRSHADRRRIRAARRSRARPRRCSLAAQADAAGAHRTIRSEIALNVALAHYGRRDFDAAERALSRRARRGHRLCARARIPRLDRVRPRRHRARDGVFVDALDSAGPLPALRSLSRSELHPRARASRRRTAGPAHVGDRRRAARADGLVRRRSSRSRGSGSRTAPRRSRSTCKAMPLKAAREAREAERIAPTTAYRVQARCKRAAIARCAGEPLSQRDHAEAAAEIYATSSRASSRATKRSSR